MPATKSLSSSRTSKAKPKAPGGSPKTGLFAAAAIVIVLAALSAGAILFFLSRGQTLWYGDAAAHVNIARRVFDTRTPGWAQVGTVWLPLPHVLMLPLVWNDALWQSGAAGAIPSGVCFVLAGLLLFLAARRAFGDTAAAVTAACLMAFNPNVLYLQAIPMTEAVFLACLAGVLYFTVRFRDGQSLGSVTAAGLFCCAATLTRYEGWFLIPFAGAYLFFSAQRRRLRVAALFCALAAAGPAYWLWHNYYFFGNAWDFYSGASSAKAIYQRALDRGMDRYPGDHDWRKAVAYLWTSIRLCAGTPLIALAAAGSFGLVIRKKAIWPVLLLALVPLFYVWSMHSGGTPVFVPNRWPFSYYNTRYAIGAMPLLAFAAGAAVSVSPRRLRKWAAAAAILIAISPWLAYPRSENWVCWKESQVNSESRRAWTREAADFLRANYRRGDGILTSFGDVTAIYQQAGIPLRETVHECNGDLFWDKIRGKAPITEKWAVAISGDEVEKALDKARKTGPRYDLVRAISVKGAPVVEIYQRHE